MLEIIKLDDINKYSWGNAIEHYRAGSQINIGKAKTVAHSILAIIEFLPLVGQAVSIAETLLAKHFFSFEKKEYVPAEEKEDWKNLLLKLEKPLTEASALLERNKNFIQLLNDNRKDPQKVRGLLNLSFVTEDFPSVQKDVQWCLEIVVQDNNTDIAKVILSSPIQESISEKTIQDCYKGNEKLSKEMKKLLEDFATSRKIKLEMKKDFEETENF